MDRTQRCLTQEAFMHVTKSASFDRLSVIYVFILNAAWQICVMYLHRGIVKTKV